MRIDGNFNVENYQDFEGAIEISLFQEYGYKFISVDNFIKTKTLQNFLNEILSKYKDLKKFNYSNSKIRTHARYYNDTFVISISGGTKETTVNFYAKSDEKLNELFRIYANHTKDSSETEIYAMFDSYYLKNNGIDKSSKFIKYKDVENISEDYYPFLDTNILFEQFCEGSENILILTGAPGIGKTKFCNLLIKFLFTNPQHIPYDKIEMLDDDDHYINIAYVKNTDILAKDEFWRTIQSDAPDIIILDDLDFMLTKRDAEIVSSEDIKKNEFLNQLLSFSDGIEKNKTKFIITTNQPFSDIDKALLRKGRLFDILEFRELTRSEALKIWLNSDLQESEFNKLFNMEFIPASSIGSEISKRKNTKSANILKEYLKDQSVSKIPSTKRIKASL